jgi:hypothetical protein
LVRSRGEECDRGFERCVGEAAQAERSRNWRERRGGREIDGWCCGEREGELVVVSD